MAKATLTQRQLPPTVLRAQEALRTDGGDPQALFDLSGDLTKGNHLEFARRVLEKARELVGADAQSSDLRIDILHQLALVTYKNPDRPLDDRLKDAEKILGELFQLRIPPKVEQDCWGIRGAIHKRRWDAYGLREHLLCSRECYLAGHAMGIAMDRGYNAINAAFVIDLLASNAELQAGEQYRLEAEQLRQAIVHEVEPMQDKPAWENGPPLKTLWWFVCTIGEAYLGLGRYKEARAWISRSPGLERKPWQLESTARQFAHLVRLRLAREGADLGKLDNLDVDAFDANDPPPEIADRYQAFLVLCDLFGGKSHAAIAAQSFTRGKVGLALSGGGFRASLYHVGVLAKLAELDVLRHVEVISCVSGGSIVGAYYYLKLQDRLSRIEDSSLRRQDYIDLVAEMEKEFLEGVQTNIRLRMLFGLPSMLKVFRGRRYLTTHRLADLYESALYSRVKDGAGPKRYLHELAVEPAGFKRESDGGNFNPKYDNWTRRNKVPTLILNATTLNTCHNWQFTATYMGEPPARGTDSEVDANARLRRMYHDEAPLYYRQHPVRLGDAVAASACVPVLFDPLILDDMYSVRAGADRSESYVTRLVDGGNYDNQGVASLLEQGCNVLLVSDASGQTDVATDPGGQRLDVLPRSNNILMARVREAEFQLMDTLRRGRVLRAFLYIHLKKGLEGGTVDWNECQDPYPAKQGEVRTEYEMRRDVQRLLAGVRTDLDTFSNAEADALMLSGYRMTGYYFPRAATGLPEANVKPGPWRFLQIASIAQATVETEELRELRKTLEVASSITWKPFRVSAPLKWSGWGLISVLAATAVYSLWGRPLVGIVPFQEALRWLGSQSLGGILLAATAIGIVLWGVKKLLTHFHYRAGLLTILGSVLFCVPAQLLLWLHLGLIEGVYKDSGPKYRT